MGTQHLVDIGYEIAKNTFKDKSFDFKELWDKIIKDQKLDKATQDELIGVFYVDLLQDPRYIFVGKNSWRLKRFVPLDQYENYSKALFNFDDVVFEEGFENVPLEKTEDDFKLSEPVINSDEDIEDDDFQATIQKINIENEE